MTMIRATLIHFCALAGGVAIIVFLTLTATYLSAKDSIQCYNCIHESCINQHQTGVKFYCKGVCLKAEMKIKVEHDEGESIETEWNQLCYRKHINSTECPQEYIRQMERDSTRKVSQCSICNTNLCNKVDEASTTSLENNYD